MLLFKENTLYIIQYKSQDAYYYNGLVFQLDETVYPSIQSFKNRIGRLHSAGKIWGDENRNQISELSGSIEREINIAKKIIGEK